MNAETAGMKANGWSDEDIERMSSVTAATIEKFHRFDNLPDSKNARKIRRTKAPSLATAERWMDEGIARATDGCPVEPDGHCEHGCPSWLLELDLI